MLPAVCRLQSCSILCLFTSSTGAACYTKNGRSPFPASLPVIAHKAAGEGYKQQMPTLTFFIT
ncbi:hypothetical protein FLA_1489 [Filimonas lacunae]|nr:hypothetical protein FLA_1489 [Filimonas lacunae]